MDTDALINALVADGKAPSMMLSSVWRRATGLAAILAASVFYTTLGPRPDIVVAAGTPRFLFKVVLMMTLAACAYAALRTLSRPEGNKCRALLPLLVVPAALVAAISIELAIVPMKNWSQRTIGASSVYCTLLIIMIGIGPLLVLILALRRGAPSSPGLSGAVAGLLAGGIAATIYALHCTDDSPLFVAIWYGIAVAGLSALGSMIAWRVARW